MSRHTRPTTVVSHTQVFDAAGVGAAEPEPGFLEGSASLMEPSILWVTALRWVR
jgi:hypothetical protein